jgi:alkaline phosphatase D
MHEASAKYKIKFIVISGDRHEAAVIRFRDPNTKRGADVFEFSVSPLSMFYLPARTFYGGDDKEQTITYSPAGNFKWAAMEITDSSDEESIMKFRLFKSGQETWTYSLSSLPGRDIPQGEVLD